MKKTLKYLLVICLLVCTFAVIVGAQTYRGVCGNNVTWILNTDTGVLEISGNGWMEDYYNSTYTPWYKFSKYIKSVKINNGVTYIGADAFMALDATSATIPDSVTSIGEGAFSNCSSLRYVTIGNNVTSLGESAFIDCYALTSISIPNSVTSIGKAAFYGCKSLTTVTIGKNVTDIGVAAFWGCKALTSVTIPDSVKYIGLEAFRSCEALKSVTIGNNVTSIGNSAFNDCKSLETVVIPAKVSMIGDYVFYKCYSLTKITVDGNNANYTSDEHGALFNYDKTTLYQYPIGNTRSSYAVPATVTSIRDYAFFDCDSLTKITIPDSVKSIGSSTFKDCDSLTIYGCSGSYAETFAKKQNIPFVSINNCIIMTIGSTNALVFGKAAKTDVPPILENDRTMLPARFVAEALGATVSWDAPTRTATISGDGVTIAITVDSKTAYVNGQAVTLDAPAFIRNDRTYIPVRFLAEALGATVDWDGAARESIITKK